ncbi:hypothetical protein D3C81_1755350 [compost metagenome]
MSLPIWRLISGTMGAKEKNAAFPDPINAEIAKVISVISRIIEAALRPNSPESESSASTAPMAFSPAEKTSPAIINVTTVANTLPMLSKTFCTPAITSRALR